MARSFSDHFKSLEGKRRARVIGMHVSKGNTKVPFYIFNMNSATDCPSLESERCQAAGNCYAIRPENFRPSVLPYRRRQEIIWKHSKAAEIAKALMELHSRRRKGAEKVFRFSESGDFRSPRDVEKMGLVSEILIDEGWESYGYTSRTDFDLSPLLERKVYVNVSNSDGDWKSKGANQFKMVDIPSGNSFVCGGDCSKCSVCRKVRGKTIEVIKH